MASEPRAAAIELAREFADGGVPKVGSDDVGYLLAAYDQMEADRDRLADAIQQVRFAAAAAHAAAVAGHAITDDYERGRIHALDDVCRTLMDQGSAEPALRTREAAAGATTTAPPPADPASHHWLTLAIEQGRLSAHLTCTAPPDSLCRLDCAVRDCEQEEQPPHTAHDGMSVHRAVDSGRCHVTAAVGDRLNAARYYEGIPGPLGTIPVDAWLGEAGPGWDLLHRHATDADADWTAQDEAGHRARQPREWQPTAAAQFWAGLEQAGLALDRARTESASDPEPVLDPSQPGFSPAHYVMELGRQVAAERDREDGAQ